MLTVHHLQRGQSERIVWLCEELGIDYDLKTYKRQPNLLAPPELSRLHPTGAAPVIQDGAVTLAESGACADFILAKYGGGKLVLKPDDPSFADYLYWTHFANGYFQPALGRYMTVARSGADLSNVSMESNPGAYLAVRGKEVSLRMLEERLGGNEWLAGEKFTVADVMTVWCVSTMRLFAPYSLEPYPAILRWLGRVSKREAYKRAMEKGDPGLEPLFGPEAPESLIPLGR